MRYLGNVLLHLMRFRHCRLRIGICNARLLSFHLASTKADGCFIIEDKICGLIINVKRKLKLTKDLLPLGSTSSQGEYRRR